MVDLKSPLQALRIKLKILTNNKQNNGKTYLKKNIYITNLLLINQNTVVFVNSIHLLQQSCFVNVGKSMMFLLRTAAKHEIDKMIP